MVKDSKCGNVILVDPDLLPFIPDLHLTPQGIVDVLNKWKASRPVFDSPFFVQSTGVKQLMIESMQH